MSGFTLTARQQEALAICAGDAAHVMLFGGSRSGKTVLHIRNMIIRALKAPGSRHCVLRFRFNHIKSSVIYDTLPKVMALAFPDVKWKLSKQDWYITINPGTERASEIWFGGLDDKERTEKILGNEYSTIFLNECSQIPWASRNVVVTRLAQKVYTKMLGREPELLAPRMYYDANPPNKLHWTYQLFFLKRDPETKEPTAKPDDFAACLMNPADNAENLSPGYLDSLKGLSARLRQRFLDGQFADANPNALFVDDCIGAWRAAEGAIPDMVRCVVAVDPSGAGDTDNADNDAIGIIVAGLGTDGNAYVLEDCTVKAGPATWGRIATSAFERYSADLIVGEVNYGGAMVNMVVQSARPRTPFRAVTSSRSKVLRLEPFVSLYEQGKIRHAGYFAELEEELAAFSTSGYTGSRSPNRADALAFALTALFPAILGTSQRPNSNVEAIPTAHHFGRAR